MSDELEKRFLKFAIDVRDYCTMLKKDVINTEYIRQLIRASGSVGANYIEGSDPLGKLDERMKIKTSRREAKESHYWLILTNTYGSVELEEIKSFLIGEAYQIRNILTSIVRKLS